MTLWQGGNRRECIGAGQNRHVVRFRQGFVNADFIQQSLETKLRPAATADAQVGIAIAEGAKQTRIVELELLLLAVEEELHLFIRLGRIERRNHVMPLLQRNPFCRFDAKRIIRPHADQIEMHFAVGKKQAVAVAFRQVVVFLGLAIADVAIALTLGALAISLAGSDLQVLGLGLLITFAFLLKGGLTWAISKKLKAV